MKTLSSLVYCVFFYCKIIENINNGKIEDVVEPGNNLNELPTSAEYQQFISDTINSGDAGVEQIAALSDHLQRSIIVYHGSDRTVCGKSHLNKRKPIQLRYFAPDSSNHRGHYVPLGESRDWGCDENNCLYHAIANRTGISSQSLRNAVVEKIKKNPSKYIELDVRVYNGNRSLFLGGAVRELGISERVRNATPSIFPHYTRVWPENTRANRQGNAAYNHIVNRFHYTWAFIRIVGDRLAAETRMNIFEAGGVTRQDQASGQGATIHAAHIARARISERFRENYPRQYEVVADLSAITENMPRELNDYHRFGGAIDFFGEHFLIQYRGDIFDFQFYQEIFFEFVRDVARGVYGDSQIVQNSAAAVVRDWSAIVANAERIIDEMVRVMMELIPAIPDRHDELRRRMPPDPHESAKDELPTITNGAYLSFIDHLIKSENSGIRHIGALSDHLQRPIIVYHGFDRTSCGKIYANKAPIQLRYMPPSNSNSIGHYIPLGENIENIFWNCGVDDCLFQAVANKTNLSVDDLRKNAAEKLKENPRNYVESYVRSYVGNRSLMFDEKPSEPGINARVKNSIPSIFPHFTHHWPENEGKQFDAAYHHIVNRFHFTWAFIRVLGGDRLKSNFGMDIFEAGGVIVQDQREGQGDHFHVGLITRPKVVDDFCRKHPDEYDDVSDLSAITENMSKTLSKNYFFGRNINFLSEYLIENPDLDLVNYQKSFLDFVRELANGLADDKVTPKAAAAVVRDWTNIVANCKKNVDNMVKPMEHLIIRHIWLKG